MRGRLSSAHALLHTEVVLGRAWLECDPRAEVADVLRRLKLLCHKELAINRYFPLPHHPTWNDAHAAEDHITCELRLVRPRWCRRPRPPCGGRHGTHQRRAQTVCTDAQARYGSVGYELEPADAAVLRGAVAPEKLPPPAAAPRDCRKSVNRCLIRLGDLARRVAMLPTASLDVAEGLQQAVYFAHSTLP